jgi:phosphoserine phosphatase
VKYKNYPSVIWDQIRQALDEERKSGKTPVAAFDADGTLWDTDLGESFFKFQISQGLLPNLPANPWRHYRDWKEAGDPRPAYLWLAQINRGHRLAEVQSWAEKAVAVREPLPIFAEQQKLIELLLKEGVQVWIVTASVKWAVEPGALRLGLRHDQVIGIETAVVDGVVTDKAAGYMTYREGKASAILDKTKGQAPFLCSGNTLGDLSLLECASRIRLAVGASTPGHEMYEAEEKLRVIGRERGWFVHQF